MTESTAGIDYDDVDWKNKWITYVVMLFLITPIGILWGMFFKIYQRKGIVAVGKGGEAKKVPVYAKIIISVLAFTVWMSALSQVGSV
ncbi:MAG: hypothetical protein COB66_05210 [Coxiella sp. (in: Bacteria)]|nr:MAG: hypothetical protein COB66_05210 [Coxiella sp. (in: g-proteobacteria)]